MRLIGEVCRERNLPAIISMHDVLLAKMFVDRIVGLRAGKIVFDGAPSKLNTAMLTEIYGEEDWTQIHHDKDETAAPEPDEHSREERMAGLA
jgi:phosphonate transport system ATP-binding protein